MFIQAKLTISKKDDFDGIISKFENVEITREKETTKDLFNPKTGNFYMIVTASQAIETFERYKQSNMSSVEFYNRLLSERRIKVIRCENLLSIIQKLYEQSFIMAKDIEVRARSPWIKSNLGNVFVGIVGAQEVARLHKENGEALFYENIRTFLGFEQSKSTREPVNREIRSTLTDNPERMLARNNGVTIRAESADVKSAELLSLHGAAIVNGCQTVSCITAASIDDTSINLDFADVLIKIVIADDGWDIAKAANSQNEVARINLLIAPYLRTSQLEKYAVSLGFAILTDQNLPITQILNRIHSSTVR